MARARDISAVRRAIGDRDKTILVSYDLLHDPQGDEIYRRELAIHSWSSPIGQEELRRIQPAAQELLVIQPPSLLTVSDTEHDVHGHFRLADTDASKPAMMHTFPLSFACLVRGRRILVRHGADPAVFPAVQTRVANHLLPHIVVRLNALVLEGTKHVSTQAYLSTEANYRRLYGARCMYMYYLRNFSPSMIKDYDPDRMGRLAEAVLTFYNMLCGSVDALNDLMSGDEREPIVVYVHCHQGLERSRYFMECVHALFYVHGRILGSRGKRINVPAYLLDWAERQKIFENHRLSLRTLLTETEEGMFQSLAHTLALVLGMEPDTVYRRLKGVERSRPVQVQEFRLSQCSAGDQCLDHSNVRFMCFCCQHAFFCSPACMEASSHLLLHQTAVPNAAANYTTTDCPDSSQVIRYR